MRSLRARILAGDRVIGTFLKTPDPHMVELLGLAGLDFIVADSEHAPIDLGALDLMAMAGRSVSLPILFRARGHDPAMISPGFDAGVTGVMVPHVRTAQNAERIADAVKYARGRRGFSPSGRAGGYGTMKPADYRMRSDETSLFMAQIEDEDALNHLDAIAGQGDVDVLFVGPADLSLSMGIAPDDPKMARAIDDVVAAARRAGIAAGLFVGGNGAEVEAWAARGVSVFVCGSDQSLLLGAARQLCATARPANERKNP
ncbi:MAG: aldolase [Nitratireductor sp.]|nr:aldolase [Nitratireductor sp.]